MTCTRTSFVRRAGVLIGALVAAFAAAPGALPCGSAGYSYAGLASSTRAHGVGANLTALGEPGVLSGHVAAWVGVGGPKQGPGGTDEWIQVGFNGLQGSPETNLYYEVARPSGSVRYHEIERGLEWGASRHVAVLETARHPNFWRVWVNGRPVSRPVFLPGSHGSWRGIATTESWGGGSFVCNRFGYRFDRISVANRAGGSWRTLSSALPIRSAGYRFVRSSAASFVAVSGTLLRPVSSPLALLTAKTKPAASAPVAAPIPAAAIDVGPASDTVQPALDEPVDAGSV